MSAAARRSIRRVLLLRVVTAALALVLVACLTGYFLVNRSVGTSLAVLNLNQDGRRDLPSDTWTGVYAGDDIAGLATLIGGDDELDRYADQLAGIDPARSFVVVRVTDTCSRTNVQLRGHGRSVELTWRQIERECYVAATTLFAWSVDYTEVDEPVQVNLCGAVWTVQQHTASRTGTKTCAADD